MIGIYLFKNNLNNKCYIGQSRDLEARKKSHLRNYSNKNLDTYNSYFYSAIRKYGIENFTYEVLFSTNKNISQEELNQLEIDYIEKYNSFGKNGYNMNKGGRFTSGEKVLNEIQVKEIKNLILNTLQNFYEIGEKFQVSELLISQINDGKIWNEVGEYNYPLRKNTYFQNIGGKNPNAKLNDEIVLKLRKAYVLKSLNQIYEENKGLCSFSTMKKAIYGVSFLHLPVYKKKEKKWFLEGTCIDYPRLEEQNYQ